MYNGKIETSLTKLYQEHWKGELKKLQTRKREDAVAVEKLKLRVRFPLCLMSFNPKTWCDNGDLGPVLGEKSGSG